MQTKKSGKLPDYSLCSQLGSELCESLPKLQDYKINPKGYSHTWHFCQANSKILERYSIISSYITASSAI